jgi:hypothetical protein
MQDPQLIWEFGRWIARRDPGTARLSWTGGEIALGVRQGRIHSALGLDPGELADRLACETTGESDLLAEARALASAHQIAETRAMGTAKEILQRAIHEWLMDPERRLDFEAEQPVVADGATISITHLLVELVLADTQRNVAESILPDRRVSLQRSSAFLELYAPLRLSEEADLIVAGLTATATVEDVAGTSNHDPEEVVRLMAALVATGVLEADEPEIPAQELDWPGTELDLDEPPGKKIPVWMIAAAAAVLALVIILFGWTMLRGDDDPDAQVAAGSGDWGIVVEMGCEPQDLQRMMRKRNIERKSLRTVPIDSAAGDTCFRLVWGSFVNRSAAEEAMGEVPADLVEEGFEPHVIEVTELDPDDGAGIQE